MASTSSTTGSAVSSLISSLGAGSGTDMTALATNLAAAQFAARNDRLTTGAATLDRQISAASSLKSLFLNLSASLGDRVRTGDLSPKPQLANPAVASASLSGTSFPKGSYSLEVTALAAGQLLASATYPAAASPVGAGTLTLRFGTVAGANFTADSARTPVDIAIASGSTLDDVARAINAAGAGVSAYVATGASGARLVTKGADGAANGFVVEAAETPGEPGLAQLAWNPGGDLTRLTRTAGDAALKVDGFPVAATGNTVTDAIPGVTLKLTSTNAGTPTTVSFADSGSAISTAMQDLTAALNQIAGELKADTDAQTGDLARDVGARGLRGALSGLAGRTVMPNASANAPRTLADLGLSTQRDGSFALDTRRLSATLARDPEGTAAMFTNGLYGVFATIDGVARTAAAVGDPSSLAGSIGRYSTQKTRIAADQAKLGAQEDALRASLVARFAVADTKVGSSRSTLTFLQNQVAAWNARSN